MRCFGGIRKPLIQMPGRQTGESLTQSIRGQCFGISRKVPSHAIGRCRKKATPLALEMFNRDSVRSEEHTSELQSRGHLVCRLLLEKKKHTTKIRPSKLGHK